MERKWKISKVTKYDSIYSAQIHEMDEKGVEKRLVA